MAVRWYLRHPLSATSVMELLAERGIDVSNRTVLRWVQAFGPAARLGDVPLQHPTTSQTQRVCVADRLRIVPNHACTVANLTDMLVGVRGGRVTEVMQVLVRGGGR